MKDVDPQTKRNLFLALIVIGLVGRWMIVPSIKNEKKRREMKANSRVSLSKFSCLDKGTCGLSELSSMPFLLGENRAKTRLELQKYENESMSNIKTFYFLSGSLVRGRDDQSSLDLLNSLDKAKRQHFLDGLYFCQHLECQQFLDQYMEKFDLVEMREMELKLLLKKAGSWKVKNGFLKELLDIYASTNQYSKALHIVDVIPNHPRLKKFIEVHYEKVVSDFLIMKAAVFLSRYNKGWHLRKEKSLIKDGSLIHMDQYLATLKNDCPADLMRLDKFVVRLKKEEKINAHSLNIYRDSLRYLVKENDFLKKKYKITDEEIVEGSLCHRSSFSSY